MDTVNEDSIRELKELIETRDIAMFVTRNDGGQLKSRPMTTQSVEDNGDVWFMTHDDATVADDVQASPQVCLNYGKHDDNIYVSVYGTALRVRDAKRIEELWSVAHNAFFPEGKDDPHLLLLRVVPGSAEVWIGPSTSVGRVIAFAKALATSDVTALGEKRDLVR